MKVLKLALAALALVVPTLLEAQVTRTRATDDVNLYVGGDGNDATCNGRFNVAYNATTNRVNCRFLTIARGLSAGALNYDLAGFNLVIHVNGNGGGAGHTGSGTYTENLTLPSWVGRTPANGFSQFKILGENGTVTMTSASASPVIFASANLSFPITFENVTMTNPAASGILVYLDDVAFISLKSVTLGATGAGGIKIASILKSQVLLQASTFQVAGNTGTMFYAQTNSAITTQPGVIFNASGATTVTNAVVDVDDTSLFMNQGSSFSGTTITGPAFRRVSPGSIYDKSLIVTSNTAGVTTGRYPLNANVTLYVNPSTTTAAQCNGSSGGVGSDSNSGALARPFASLGKAISVAQKEYDAQLFQVTIQLCDNNVTGATYPVTQMTANLVGAPSGGNATTAQLIIQGNTTTRSNVIVQGSGGVSAFTFVGVTSPVSIKNMQIGATLIGGATTGHGIQSDAHSMVYYSDITWGFFNTSYSHMVATYGSFIEQEGPETIIGGAALHWLATQQSKILMTGQTITCTGTPAFASGFVGVLNASTFSLNGSTFSGCGGVTGTRYLSDNTSTFGTGTADPNTVYPGSVNGGVNLPSYGLTGILLGNGGPPTGGAQVTAMAAMNGDATLNLGTGAISVTKINGTDMTTAWGSFTPSLSCGTATFSVTTSTFKTVGKTTNMQMHFSITAIGTCTNLMSFNLPATAAAAGLIPAFESLNRNMSIGCVILASGSTTAACVQTSGVAFAVNDVIRMSGVYTNQ